MDNVLAWTGATETPLQVIVVRLFLALVFGIAIGLEREIRGKAAGLRTHMLVALASAAFALIALEMARTVGDESLAVRADPIRVIEAVVAGVAFLGAGAIIQARGSVVGVTTGASVWLVGAVGVACGGGYFAIAAMTVTLAFATLTIINYIEVKMHRHLLDGSENPIETGGGSHKADDTNG